jgi:hypothetical protein
MRFSHVVPFLLTVVDADIGRYIVGGISGPTIDIPPPTAAPNPTACGQIVNSDCNCFKHAHLHPQQLTFLAIVFNASLSYQCLTSVPFDPAVATRFLTYLFDTLQFQSTLAYLKNPPAGYKQPGVDLIQGIKTIQEWVNTPGKFPNQYAFEATLQRYVNSLLNIANPLLERLLKLATLTD